MVLHPPQEKNQRPGDEAKRGPLATRSPTPSAATPGRKSVPGRSLQFFLHQPERLSGACRMSPHRPRGLRRLPDFEHPHRPVALAEIDDYPERIEPDRHDEPGPTLERGGDLRPLRVGEALLVE